MSYSVRLSWRFAIVAGLYVLVMGNCGQFERCRGRSLESEPRMHLWKFPAAKRLAVLCAEKRSPAPYFTASFVPLDAQDPTKSTEPFAMAVCVRREATR